MERGRPPTNTTLRAGARRSSRSQRGMPCLRRSRLNKSVGANPLQLGPAIRTQVAQIDPNQPIHDVVTLLKVFFRVIPGATLPLDRTVWRLRPA